MQSPYYHPEPHWWPFWSLTAYLEHLADRLEQHMTQLLSTRGHF